MTSSTGNIFGVTGHLCREFTGPQWIPHTKASDAELWCLLRPNKRLSKQSWGWWFETLSCSLWRHRNVLTIDIPLFGREGDTWGVFCETTVWLMFYLNYYCMKYCVIMDLIIMDNWVIYASCFPQSSHVSYLIIPHPWGRGMDILMWVESQTYTFDPFVIFEVCSKHCPID